MKEKNHPPNEAMRMLDALKLIKLEALTCTDSPRSLAHIVRLCIDAGVTEHLEELHAFKRQAIVDAVFTPLLGENDEEIKRLRDALAEFGQHKAGCEHDDFESPMCNCGFQKALSPD